MEESPKPMTKYAQDLAEKRARASKKQRGLWEGYNAGLLHPDEIKAELRKLAQEQIKEVGLESYH